MIDLRVLVLALWFLCSASLSAQDCVAETEPNDRPAEATALIGVGCVEGVLTSNADDDYYRLPIDSVLSARALEIALTGVPAGEARLCLLNSEGRRLQCRQSEAEGEPVVLPDLAVSEGESIIAVEGNGGGPEARYVLRIRDTAPQTAGVEAEPNDTMENAVSLGPEYTIRGRFSGEEVDYFRFRSEGGAQLWRIQVQGDGLGSLVYYNSGGQIEQQLRAEADTRRLRLPNLFLLPGPHTVAVKGREGSYTLRALPLGPPRADHEREPNDDRSRASLLSIGETQTGLLAENQDRDFFRFFLTAEEHIAVRVTPPAEGSLGFRLDWDGRSFARRKGVISGQEVVYEALLRPGDYHLELFATTPVDAEYQVALERLDPFDRTGDLEPNDDPASARPLPPTLRVAGSVDDGDPADWYRLPDLPAGTIVTLRTGDNVRPQIVDQRGELVSRLTAEPESGEYRGELSGAGSHSLKVNGSGAYELELVFDPDPAPVEELSIELSFAETLPTVAAYWHAGQHIASELTIANRGRDRVRLVLDATTSHYGWQVSLAESEVVLQPGESRRMPYTVAVEPDAWADWPVRLTVRARSDDGAQQTAGFDLRAARDATPVHPAPFWPLPAALRGGLNVAWSAFGAEPVAQEERLAAKQAALHDGMTPSQDGFLVGDRELPPGRSVTVRLAGTAPIPVAGFLLHPQAKGSAESRLRDFEISLSTDGRDFQRVLSGKLNPLPREQAFALPAPSPARYAKLTLRSTHGTVEHSLGEWKVVAAPHDRSLGPAGFNLAEPARGGHVVWLRPPAKGKAAGYDQIQGVLSETVEALWAPLEPSASTVEWVVGFHHNRAAQITRLDWVDTPATKAERQTSEIVLSVSTESPAGPWRPIGTWNLSRSSAGVAPFLLEQPVWARYVRFTARVGDDGRAVEYPETLRVFERPVGGDYRSILGEWGHYSQVAIYEEREQRDRPPNAVELERADRREDAPPLGLGRRVRGQVEIGRNSDWYRIEVPDGRNALYVQIEGTPSVAVRAALEDDTHEPVRLQTVSTAPRKVELKAAVEERSTYWLRVDEPPRSIVFAWDNSGSVSQYAPVIYASLARFAEEIQPDIEVVNLLPFADLPRLLMPRWSGSTEEVLTALTSYGRGDNSSAAERNLLAATEALAEREGTKAILFITDAKSAGVSESANLWNALASARPHVFALQFSLIGGTGGIRDLSLEQDLMQDWAAVGGGVYEAISTQGELDRAFDRAATWLRRPASYTLMAEAATEIPPGPGFLRVIAPTDRTGFLPATGIEIILDASGSMLQRMDGVRRIDIAKRVLTDLVTDTLPAALPIFLILFVNLT